MNGIWYTSRRHLEEHVVGVNSDPLTCVRREVWGMLYDADAEIVS